VFLFGTNQTSKKNNNNIEHGGIRGVQLAPALTGKEAEERDEDSSHECIKSNPLKRNNIISKPKYQKNDIEFIPLSMI
jgi:hypothetical protein